MEPKQESTRTISATIILMTDEYINRTLRAYDAYPEKYEEATAGMTPIEELEAFIAQLPSTTHMVLDAGCAFGRDTSLFAKQGLKTLGY